MTFDGRLEEIWNEPRPTGGPVLRDLGPDEENESNMDRRFRGAYEIPDVPPTFEYDPQGNILLGVEPGSIQAKLITTANSMLMWNKIGALKQGGIPEDEELGLRAEIKDLEALNERLRGNPPKPDTTQIVKKPGLRERMGQTILDLSGSGVMARPTIATEAHSIPEGMATGSTFVNMDAANLLHNLSLVAADLRQQVQQGIALDPTRASDMAEDMIDLRASTMMLLEKSPAPQIHQI